jgi:CHAD domain-containing protein
MSRKQDLPHTDAAHVAPALAAIERARHAEPIVLKPDKSLAAAFEVIAANCLAQVRDNTPGVAAGDAESVHQMRVGLRRLRCLLRLLPRRIELPGTLVQELEWLSHTLGAARDGHVLASTTLPGLARSCVEPPNWRALRRTANATANASARTASGLATSDRFA